MEMNSRFNAKVLCNEGKDTKRRRKWEKGSSVYTMAL
jgi:hypothetical protein